jgi:hypothetical protein
MKKIIRQILIEETEGDINKTIRGIKKLLSLIKWDGLCNIWVEYNPVDREYEIRSKYVGEDFNFDEVHKELEYLDKTLRSMGIRPYIFAPFFVDSCEDEVNFMNESKEVDKIKLSKKIIQTIFDNVTHIEQKKYENKPLLKVYFERISNAANEDSWMTHQICDKIDEYTSGTIIAAPSWGPEWSERKKKSDLYIDASEGGVVEFDNPF